MDRNISAFLAIVEKGNLTEAAEVVGLAQPSLTKRLQNLEVEMGVALFERHRRGMRLTDAGRHFLNRANRIRTEYRQAREEMASLRSAGIQILRVGAGPLFHLRYVAAIFKQLKQRFPGLTLELLADANIRTIPMLKEERLDIVLGLITPDRLDDSILVKPVTEVEHGIVLRRDDPVASMVKVDPANIKDKKWVLYTEDPETEDTISYYFLPHGQSVPMIDVRTSSFNTGLQMIKMGGFVMSAPLQLSSVVESEGLVIRPSVYPMPRNKAGAYVRRSALGFPAVQHFLQELELVVSK